MLSDNEGSPPPEEQGVFPSCGGGSSSSGDRGQRDAVHAEPWERHRQTRGRGGGRRRRRRSRESARDVLMMVNSRDALQETDHPASHERTQHATDIDRGSFLKFRESTSIFFQKKSRRRPQDNLLHKFNTTGIPPSSRCGGDCVRRLHFT